MSHISMTVLRDEYDTITWVDGLELTTVVEVGPEGGNPWVKLCGPRHAIVAFLQRSRPDDASFLATRIVD